MNTAKITKDELEVFEELAEEAHLVCGPAAQLKNLATRAQRICYLKGAEIKINRKKKQSIASRIFEESAQCGCDQD